MSRTQVPIIGSDNISVIDISNPSSPSTVSTFTVGDRPRGIEVKGRYAYVAESYENSIAILDISNPASLSLVSRLNLGGDVRSLSVQGRYAYVTSHNFGSMYIVDVANPAAPKKIATVGGFTAPFGVFASGRYAYVADDGLDQLLVVDISDPASASVVETVPVGTSPVSVYVSGRYAYVANFSGTVSVVDISNPTAISVVKTVSVSSSPNKIFVQGNYVYTVGYASGTTLDIIDISVPTSAYLLSTISVPSSTGADGIFVSGQYIYFADSDIGAFYIYDAKGIETNGLFASSAGFGSVQIQNDLITLGHIQVAGGINVGQGGINSAGPLGVYGPAAFGGNVGIGTSSPYSKLSVWGAGTGTNRLFELTNNASTTLASLLENGTGYFLGNIGIGTTSPFAKLSINPIAGDGNQFAIGSTTHMSFLVDSRGNVAIGTTTAYLDSVNLSGLVVAPNPTYTGGRRPVIGLEDLYSRAGHAIGDFRIRASDATASQVEVWSMSFRGDAAFAPDESLTFYFDRASNSYPVLALLNDQNANFYGNVGVGSTSPWALLSVQQTAGDVGFAVGSSTATSFIVDKNRNVGIGTSSPWAKLSVNQNAGEVAFAIGSTTGTNLIFDQNGTLILGTTTPGVGTKLQISTNNPAAFGLVSARSDSTTGDNIVVNATAAGIGGGTNYALYGWASGSSVNNWGLYIESGDVYAANKVFFNALTSAAGTPYTVCMNSATKEITVNAAQTCTVSSARFKHDIQTLDISALDLLSQITPSSFIYNNSDDKARWGLIAENLASVSPYLAAYDAEGKPHSIDFPAIFALLIKSVQELSAKVDALANNAVSNLSTAAQLVLEKLTAQKIVVREGFEITDQETGEVYCVTIKNGEWNKLLGECGVSRNTENDTPIQNIAGPVLDTLPPVITISGNNPAEITTGQSYADLGAVITDNKDSNPTTYTLVDGATTTQAVFIDSSVPGTHTITYIAIDDVGNTARADRTVDVVDAQTQETATTTQETATSTENVI